MMNKILEPGFCGYVVSESINDHSIKSRIVELIKTILRPVWRRGKYLIINIMMILRNSNQGLVYIDPCLVRYTVNKNDTTLKRNNMWHFGKIEDGDWDLNGIPVKEYGNTYFILKKRMENNIELYAIQEFQQNLELIKQGQCPDNCGTEELYYAKWKRIEELYKRIKKVGYQSQKDLSSGHPFNEIRVQIGRNGEYLFEEGIHRLIIALVLKIEQIPVIVTRRHKDWIA